MNCRDVREVADSFLGDELLTETNHQILQHLGTCLSCRTEFAARRQLRVSLRGAFERAPDLQPRPDFLAQLRDQMAVSAADAGRNGSISRQWLMLAAGLVLTAGLTGAAFLSHHGAPADALARDAIGDHWNCALKHRKVRTPVPLEEAARRFDSVYRVLLNAPPDEIPTPGGPVRVVARHSCAFGTRRFGHVILEYRDHVVSLLVTADDGGPGGVALPPDLDPHLHGAPVDGLSVASIRGARHTILLVSDLDATELTRLSTTVSVPLVDQLVSGLTPPAPSAVALFDATPAIDAVLGRGR